MLPTGPRLYPSAYIPVSLAVLSPTPSFLFSAPIYTYIYQDDDKYEDDKYRMDCTEEDHHNMVAAGFMNYSPPDDLKPGRVSKYI